MSLLKIDNLSVSFKTEFGVIDVIDNISYEVNEREIVGIVGESGCGKTMSSLTTMRLLPPNGIVKSGTIMFQGTDLLKLSQKEMRKIRGKEITMIFQEPMKALDPVYTIGDQITEALKTHVNLSKKEYYDRTIDVIKAVEIPNPERIYRCYPHELSGGMKQRIMIAMAMVMDPKLLIADEPTTALDVTIQAQVLDLMKNLIGKTNTSIIFITHDMGVVAEFCHKVMVMYAGHIVEKAEKKELFRHPKHPYTIGLMNAIPKLNETREELSYIEGSVPSPENFPKGCRFSTRCPECQEKCRVLAPPLIKVDNSEVKCWKYESYTAEGEDHED